MAKVAGFTFEQASMTGASSGDNGAAGAVPAPLAGQQTYFLRGDGTWAAGSGGATNVGVTPSSTKVTLTSSTGTGADIDAVDATNAGVMTSAQRALLYGLGASATHDATYTFTPSDAGTVCYHSSASAHTWTIDTNANQAIPVSSVITINTGQSSGTVTIAAAGGVTLERCDGITGTGNRTVGPAGWVTIWQRATNTWVIGGSSLA